MPIYLMNSAIRNSYALGVSQLIIGIIMIFISVLLAYYILKSHNFILEDAIVYIIFALIFPIMGLIMMLGLALPNIIAPEYTAMERLYQSVKFQHESI